MSIANEITRLQQAKEDIKTSIENKGVSIPPSANLDAYSGYIDQIEQGGGQWTVDYPSAEFTGAYSFIHENIGGSGSTYGSLSDVFSYIYGDYLFFSVGYKGSTNTKDYYNTYLYAAKKGWTAPKFVLVSSKGFSDGVGGKDKGIIINEGNITLWTSCSGGYTLEGIFDFSTDEWGSISTGGSDESYEKGQNMGLLSARRIIGGQSSGSYSIIFSHIKQI